MAKIIEWSEDQKQQWAEWVASRPPVVQELCKRFPPCNLYRLKSTGHRVTVYSYSENETLTVNVTGEYNAVMFDRKVFGIKPDDLEECNLPTTDDTTGTVLTDKKDIESYIDIIRPAIIGNKDFDV
jgi:hypothetical protein